jgi:copper chaperone CopZ
MRKTMIVGVALMAASLMLLTQAIGQTTTKETIISIEDLDCPVCAKNVEKAVSSVAGVREVKTDVEKQEATVTADANKTPSPKAMWEAVESAGFKPTKMVGPGGTFTKKPAS